MLILSDGPNRMERVKTRVTKDGVDADGRPLYSVVGTFVPVVPSSVDCPSTVDIRALYVLSPAVAFEVMTSKAFEWMATEAAK